MKGVELHRFDSEADANFCVCNYIMDYCSLIRPINGIWADSLSFTTFCKEKKIMVNYGFLSGNYRNKVRNTFIFHMPINHVNFLLILLSLDLFNNGKAKCFVYIYRNT